MPQLPPQHKSIEDIITAITQITTTQSQSFQEFARTVRTTMNYTLMRATIASVILKRLKTLEPVNHETFDKEALYFFVGVYETTGIIYGPESIKVLFDRLPQKRNWSEKEIGNFGTGVFLGVEQIRRSFEVDPTGISYLSSYLAEAEKDPKLKESSSIKGVRFLTELYETTVNKIFNP